MQPADAVLMGTVEAGPLYPLTMPDRPNSRPVPGALVEALHDGNVVAATTTDEAGRYELSVHPGTYLIRARAEGLYSKEPGRTVTVCPGETLSVLFVLDTGIRCRGHQPATCPLRARCQWAILTPLPIPSCSTRSATRSPSVVELPVKRGGSAVVSGRLA
jgi:hypothetical protein